MASPDTNVLLIPISDDQPTGIDVRQDASPLSKYQSLKSARAAARAAERQAIHDGDSTAADEHWRKIISLAPDILTNQSKDLEVACWFTEALIRRNGFQGLRDGFELIKGLVENFWDGLYPMPDEDGMETRTAPLSGLNGEGAEGVLIAPIRKVPITEGYSPGPFSLWQYQQALEAQRSPDEDTRQNKMAKLGFSIDDIERAVNESSVQFYVDLTDNLSTAINIYKELGTLLDERCGADSAPPTRNIISILEECRGAVSHLGKDKIPAPEESESATENEPDANAGVSQSAPQATAKAAPGVINSREAAFKQLLEIAKFFRKTEPHSPVSYVIEKAVKWGNMPLNELINELIPDSSSRERYSELTGVKDED
ncbi:MAG: type VI secretion system protein TssA [Gammaproteobacteria bacterium]|nr:MAG: type VI secretion system protein TssA [Gammaproteobacteria bacterium]